MNFMYLKGVERPAAEIGYPHTESRLVVMLMRDGGLLRSLSGNHCGGLEEM